MGDLPQWRMVVSFTIPGEPVALGRPRVTKHGRVYTDAKSRAWMEKVGYLASMAAHKVEGLPLGPKTPVLLEMETVHKRPANLFRFCDMGGRAPKTSKPDLSNIIKGGEDGITLAGCIWPDDDQVTDLRAQKRWAHIMDKREKLTEEPHTVVRVYADGRS